MLNTKNRRQESDSCRRFSKFTLAVLGLDVLENIIFTDAMRPYKDNDIAFANLPSGSEK